MRNSVDGDPRQIEADIEAYRKKKRAAHMSKKYHKDPEAARKRAREWHAKHYSIPENREKRRAYPT